MPAALIGVDVETLLHRAHRMAEACAACVPTLENPAAWLGAILGEAALAGRDKATFVLSPGIASFGLWAEQLIAESTGKEGKGILPVADEPLGRPEVYGDDRVFVSMALAGEADARSRGAPGRAGGTPAIRWSISGWTTATTSGRSSSAGSSPPRWRARCSASIRSTSPTSPRARRTPRRCWRRGRAPSPAASAAELERFLADIKPGDYLAIMAYLPPTPENDRRLAAIRLRLRDRLKVATTLGYGPRFLHSTGQLHKGGPPVGHFLQITEPVGG